MGLRVWGLLFSGSGVRAQGLRGLGFPCGPTSCFFFLAETPVYRFAVCVTGRKLMQYQQRCALQWQVAARNTSDCSKKT